MICTFYYQGYLPQTERYVYNVFTEIGTSFRAEEAEYLGKIYNVVLPDDMGQPDSGWVRWKCEKCGLKYSTRTRPKGKVVCPMCDHEEECPIDARLMLDEDSGVYLDEEDGQ